MSTTLTLIEGHRAAYYPPELHEDSGSCDSSIDVYMFGVLMLQIVHTIPCVQSRRQRNGLIEALSSEHILKKFVVLCTEREKNKRPTAEEIHTKLKAVYESYKSKVESKNRDPGNGN